MKFSIAVGNLIKPLKAISHIVNNKHANPLLAKCYLEINEEGAKMIGSNSETEIQVKVEGLNNSSNKKILFDAKKLLDIISLMNSISVDLEIEEKYLKISNMKENYSLNIINGNDYPTISSNNDNLIKFEIKQKDLKFIIEKASFAMAESDIRPYLCGCLMELHNDRINIVATDSFKLAFQTHKLEEVSFDDLKQYIIPKTAVKEISRLLETGDKKVMVNCSTNAIKLNWDNIQITSILTDNNYPAYANVIPAKGKNLLIVNKEQLINAIKKLEILSLDESSKGMSFDVKQGKIIFSFQNNTNEEANNEIEAETHIEKEMLINFNIQFLKQIISAINSEKVVFYIYDPNSTVLIQEYENEHFKSILSPMKL